MVKLEFAARQPSQTSPWTLATLVFDSLSQPLTAGVRSGVSDSRQLMFDAEGTMVDLVLDTRPNPERSPWSVRSWTKRSEDRPTRR